MSEMFSSEMEVEEGSPMGGGECNESPVHMMEPQVELDEDLDHNTLEPKVELEEHIVEPHIEFQEGTTDHNENNVYSFDPLAPEYFAETDGTVDSTGTNYQEGEASAHEYSEAALNGLSQDSEDTNTALNDNSLCNSVDTSLDATMDTSNSGLMDSNLQEDDNTDYNEMQRTYLKDFYSSSAFPTSTDESSDNSFVERIPLSRFPSIVKVVERAEYETIQILYQLLYQRSAWDTQELLSKRILEFSGFPFNKNSDEYYHRDMLLQTLPNSVLVKIGAILCLEQVKNVLSNVGLGRHDLINAIMDFLTLPRKKTRASRFSSANANNNNQAVSQNVEPCGCRNSCLSKFTEAERDVIAAHHKTIKPKKRAEAYFLSLITINKASKRPDDDAKKHRDYKYSYKIKVGKKEVSVCKGGFMMLHNVKMSMLNHLQLVLKTERYNINLIPKVTYPFIEGQEVPEAESTPVPLSNESESKDSLSAESSKDDKDAVIEDDEIKQKIAAKVPAVMVEKIDPSKISPKKKKQANNEKKEDSKDDAPGTKKDDNVRKKLRDFPLVVKSLEEASETLLIDLHFLLFSNSADSDKLKDNILDFDGFKFSADSEEYDERNEFFQRMSGKLITDVSRALSLGVMSKREETIQNILSFLMKPDESYLRTAVSVPVILSDVELDDMEGFSDSDESITCEVVEKKVECIDLLSSGEDSDREDGKKKQTIKKEKASPMPKATPVAAPVSAPSVSVPKTTTPAPSVSNSTATSTTSQSASSGVVRRLRDFETIRKIVNTHPPEYLVDIYELLFLKKNEVNSDSLRNEILDFTGFSFEKGAPEYVKRKQVLDRMLYNNVRRVYNTLIHNSTEVKVFSKPTMINEIFQFLFKLPDHDTSVRPLPPGAKTLMPKAPNSAATTKVKSSPAPSAPPTSAPASILPSQSGKLSDLKRVFQRVACFPCEYLVDVHKLLFMTDCDPKVIRQNIFGFKGFSFGVDSTEFQQRKMYLEYLTFHSLRKISSVLTTRSVDLRNSTKHELASHLTDVLAEYCNTCIDTESITPTSAKESATTTAATTTATTTTTVTSKAPEKTVTPVIQGVQSVASSKTSTAASKTSKAAKPKNNALNISIVETHSITSPSVTSSSPAKGSRKRKSQTVRQMVSEKKTPPAPTPQPSDFADIHLPEVEQYRQIYGANLNVFAEEYAEFFASPTKTAKNKLSPKRNYKQKPEPKKLNKNCSADYVEISSFDIERIKKTKWIVALERIDINVCGMNVDSLKSDKLVPDLKTNKLNDEDNLVYPVHPTPTYQEEFASQSAQSQSLYDSIFSLIDPCCKENISTKNSMMDACNEDPNVPTITGITSFGSPIAQPFSQLVPQTVTFPLVSPYPQALQVSGQPAQVIGLQSTPITMNSPIITQVTSKLPEIIVPADIDQTNAESQKTKAESPAEKSGTSSKDSPSKDSEEDGDQPLASLIGHPTDTVLQKHIADIVDKTDLQDITMNGVIQRVYDLYPKFDLSYRKEFIKSTLRTILYKLGDSDNKEGTRDSTSPDCSVSTSDIQDSAPESPKTSA